MNKQIEEFKERKSLMKIEWAAIQKKMDNENRYLVLASCVLIPSVFIEEYSRATNFKEFYLVAAVISLFISVNTIHMIIAWWMNKREYKAMKNRCINPKNC